LQDVVELEAGRHESLLDFSERFSAKDRTGGQIRPPDPVADADRNPEPDAQ
jgi:hypothetical protein